MRIAEYKQIDTERIWVEPTYGTDAEGNQTEMITEGYYKEIPIMGMVYRDMTEEEEAEMQKSALEEALTFRPTTIEEKMQMLAEQIEEVLPEGTKQARDINGTVQLPFKVGYRWEKKLVGNQIIYESVADPQAIGTQQNPIIYTEDSPLIDNAWYKFGDVLKVYMQGEFEEM